MLLVKQSKDRVAEPEVQCKRPARLDLILQVAHDPVFAQLVHRKSARQGRASDLIGSKLLQRCEGHGAVFAIVLVQLDLANLHTGLERLQAVLPDNVVKLRERIADIHGVVLIGLRNKAGPGSGRDRNLELRAACIAVVGVVGRAVIPKLQLVRQARAEDVQVLHDAVDGVGHALFQIGRRG